MPLRSRLSLRSFSLLALLLAGACTNVRTQDDRRSDVLALVRHGAYEDAYQLARELAEAAPGDKSLTVLVRDTEIAVRLEAGRRAILGGDGDAALEIFRAALERDPTNDITRGWLRKTRIQLAEEALDLATTLIATDDLERTEKTFERALSMTPNEDLSDRAERVRELAGLGLARTLLTKNYRELQSKNYYRDGIREFREFFLDRSRRDFSVSEKYDRTNVRATERRIGVDLVRAIERLAKAHGLEDSGMFFAARTEYRLVLLLDSENAEAMAGLDRMDREVRAHRTLARAEMTLLRGAFEAAESLLDEAAEVTLVQTDSLGRLRAALQDARHETAYRVARGFEQDYRYPEAVAAYSELLAAAEFYEDAIARKSTIEEFIQLAEQRYASALAAESDEEAAVFLRQIPVFWPEYLDVDERLEAVEARLAEKQAAADDSSQ